MRAALVDLDDTIFPHAQYAKRALLAAAREFKRRTGLAAKDFFDEAWRRYALNGSRDNRAFSDIMRAKNCYSPELEEQVVAAYRRSRPRLRPYPEAVLGLEQLRHAGLMLGLITDGRSAVQRLKIKALNLAPFFDEMVVTGDFGPAWAKPARHAFELLLNRFGCDPGDAVMVGDDPRADGVGARAVGLPMIRVRQGRYRAEEYAEADAEFGNIGTAFAWILQLRRHGNEPA